MPRVTKPRLIVGPVRSGMVIEKRTSYCKILSESKVYIAHCSENRIFRYEIGYRVEFIASVVHDNVPSAHVRRVISTRSKIVSELFNSKEIEHRYYTLELADLAKYKSVQEYCLKYKCEYKGVLLTPTKTLFLFMEQ